MMEKTNIEDKKVESITIDEKINKIIKEQLSEDGDIYDFYNTDKIRNETYDDEVEDEDKFNKFYILNEEGKFYLVEKRPIFPNEYGISDTCEDVDKTEFDLDDIKDMIKNIDF